MYHDSKKKYFTFEEVADFPLTLKLRLSSQDLHGLANSNWTSFVQGKVSYKFGFTLLQITSVVYCR